VSTETPTPAPRKWWQPNLREKWESLKAEHATPGRLGVAVGVGVFCGCSPVHGFQFLLALGLAWLLRLNKVAVLIGLQVSAPPITPVIIFAGFQVGELVQHGRFLPLSISQIRQLSGDSLARTLVTDFVLGSVVLGLVLGVLIGTATWLGYRSFLHSRRIDAAVSNGQNHPA
jgi:uncharacterized protein (DUF2062 family)